MYSQVYSKIVEGFSSSPSDGGAVVLATIGVILLIVVQLFIVQWLWNTVLVRTVSIVKPLPSLLYTLGLLLLVAMLHPGA